MQIRIRDYGNKVGENNQLYSIGKTSIVAEWIDKENGIIFYRMLLDFGMRSYHPNNNWHERLLDNDNIIMIRNLLNDKILGFDNGIQGVILTHCHEDHVGAIPWLYQYCRNNNIIPPKLYMTHSTWTQFKIFQTALYDIFHDPAKEAGFSWDIDIIKYIFDKKLVVLQGFNSVLTLGEEDDYRYKPKGFDVSIKFLKSGHTVGSSMVLIDTNNGKSLGNVLYTGDMCVRRAGFLIDPFDVERFANIKCNTIIMEGTYFLSDAEKKTAEQIKVEVRNRIRDTFSKGGNVIFLVYTVDRTANILSLLRELVDESGEESIGNDIKGKIYLDTMTGREISQSYDEDIETFGKIDILSPDSGCFSRYLIDRAINSGRGMFQCNDGINVYRTVGKNTRFDIIEKYRNGSCIVIATSATLEGGTALIHGSYMHEKGWGCNTNDLFLIVGGAIRGTKADYIMKQLEIFGEVTLKYLVKDGDSYYPEDSKFTAILDTLSGFSAHATQSELVRFIERSNCQKFIVTHLGSSTDGGNLSINRYEHEINKLIGKKIYVLGDKEYPILLDLHQYSIDVDNNTYTRFYDKCIRDKKTYNSLIASDLIRRLISEDDQRLAKLKTIQ